MEKKQKKLEDSARKVEKFKPLTKENLIVNISNII